ncbi:SDR family NAD(P)-dependent oxidoreductase [Mycobacterium sp. BMJ-28]
MSTHVPRRSLVLTGPTSGLGLALAQRIMDSGSHQAVFLCRNEKRHAELRARFGARDARYVVCDLSDLAGVRRAAADVNDWLLSDELAPLGAVVLNAAVHPGARTDRTPDGLDATLVTNLIAPHLLLALLLRHADVAHHVRVVFVGSGAHARRRWWTGLPAPATLSMEPVERSGISSGPQAYVASKRATVQLCRAYAERAPQGLGVLSYDPGIMAQTNIARNLNWLSRWSFRHLMTKFNGMSGFSSPERSAAWLHEHLTRAELPSRLLYAKIDQYEPWPATASQAARALGVFDEVNSVAGITTDVTAPWWWAPGSGRSDS